jgi:hypothetical protein
LRVGLAPPGPARDVTLATGAVAAGLLALARVFPFEAVPLFRCPLRTLAHVPCPSCGMTRAFVRLAHGDLAGALHVSPLGTVLACAAAALVVYAALRATVLRRGVRVESTERERTFAARAFVAVAAANWAYLLVTRAAG